MPNDRWQPCFADPVRGVAFFDGVKIEADSIMDPRWDRVEPVFEEEQVFLCRLMRPTLERLVRDAPPDAPPLVLDVGTGSGVFAIWAALLGCRVVAIDISQRALMMALANRKANEATVLVPPAEPGKAPEQLRVVEGMPVSAGDICFREMRLDGLADDSGFYREFDVVILGPPYTPTCCHVLPTQHAEAGPLGQDQFHEWLGEVPKVMKADGRCFGHHMFLADQSGALLFEPAVTLEDRLRDLVGCQAWLWSTRVLVSGSGAGIADDIPVSDFLKQQYRSYLERDEEDELGVRDYIERQPGDLYFAYVCYEFARQRPAAELLPSAPTVPDVTWETRIGWHRCVVDHTAPPGSVPANSLLLKHSSVTDLPPQRCRQTGGREPQDPSDAPGVEPDMPTADDLKEYSVLRIADKWLTRVGALDPTARVHFDMIVVDTAPWFESAQYLDELWEECMVWLPEDSRELKHAVASLWHVNTANSLEKGIGPFLHPYFTGEADPEHVRCLQSSFIAAGNESPSVTYGDEYARSSYETTRRVLGAAWQSVLSPPSAEATPLGTVAADRVASMTRELCGSAKADAMLRGIRFSEDSSYSTTVLTAYGGNWKMLAARAENRLRANVPGYVPEAGRITVETRRRVATDLAGCHAAIHQWLHSAYGDLMGPEKRWSNLTDMPVAILARGALRDGTRPGEQQYDEPHQIAPMEYRGATLVYACSSQQWTPEHEALLREFQTLLWMLYEGRYGEDAAELTAKLETETELARYARGASHSLKNALSAPASDLLQGIRSREHFLGGWLRDVRNAHLDHIANSMARSLSWQLLGKQGVEFLRRQAEMMFWIMDPKRMMDDANKLGEPVDLDAAVPELVRLAMYAALDKAQTEVAERKIDGALLVASLANAALKRGAAGKDLADPLAKALGEGSVVSFSWSPTTVSALSFRIFENIAYELLLNAFARLFMCPCGSVPRFWFTVDYGNNRLNAIVANSALDKDLVDLAAGFPESSIADPGSGSKGIRGLHQIQLLARTVNRQMPNQVAVRLSGQADRDADGGVGLATVRLTVTNSTEGEPQNVQDAVR